MAAPLTQSLSVQLRQPGTLLHNFDVPARPKSTLTLKFSSPDWLTTPGLHFGYRGRKSIDQGATWTDAGGFTAASPTYAKDGVTQIEPGGVWGWDGVASWLQVQVITQTAFTWGLTLTIADAP